MKSSITTSEWYASEVKVKGVAECAYGKGVYTCTYFIDAIHKKVILQSAGCHLILTTKHNNGAYA